VRGAGDYRRDDVAAGEPGEQNGQRGLEAKGFKTYCPITRRLTRHARITTLKVYPLFARYLFIRFSMAEEWSDPIRSTDGVIDLLQNNWLPVPVPDWVIDEIQEREANGEFDQKLPAKHQKIRWIKSFETLRQLLDNAQSPLTSPSV